MTVIARASGARAGAGAPRALTVSSNFARRRRDPILARWLADLDRASRSDNWPALEVLCGFPHADVGAAVAVLAMRGRARELGNVLEKRLDTTRPVGDETWEEALTRAGRAAASRGERDALDVLLAHGMPKDGALLEAACADGVSEASRAACVERLLDAGADANTRWSRQGWKPLHAVAKRGDVRCIELLVSRGGADLDARYFSGKTALFSACEWGQWEAARMLLSLGATVEVGQWEADHLNTDHSLGANNEPVSPRDVALAMHHDACVRVIDEVLALRRAR